MKVLITGANGFLGKNLQVRLQEKQIETVSFTRSSQLSDLPQVLKSIDFVFHFAGINRPNNDSEFQKGNQKFTQLLCDAIRVSGHKIPVLFSSTIQAESKSQYGLSKKAAESALISLERETGSPVYIYRLSNVFGKWSRPNYNSVVSTFCHNVANGLDIEIHNPNTQLRLIYIDDVIAEFLHQLLKRPLGLHRLEVKPSYEVTLSELAEQILRFKLSRDDLTIAAVGSGLVRGLYATYLSYLSPDQFSYPLMGHKDDRGQFVEIIKTKDSGQFSFFTAKPGVTRGKHFHHTKNEKFLVVRGAARFRFRNVLTNEVFEKLTNDVNLEVVESVPGWAHEISNVGDEEMIVFLWANEVFDHAASDTIPIEV